MPIPDNLLEGITVTGPRAGGGLGGSGFGGVLGAVLGGLGGAPGGSPFAHDPGALAAQIQRMFGPSPTPPPASGSAPAPNEVDPLTVVGPRPASAGLGGLVPAALGAGALGTALAAAGGGGAPGTPTSTSSASSPVPDPTAAAGAAPANEVSPLTITADKAGEAGGEGLGTLGDLALGTAVGAGAAGLAGGGSSTPGDKSNDALGETSLGAAAGAGAAGGGGAGGVLGTGIPAKDLVAGLILGGGLLTNGGGGGTGDPNGDALTSLADKNAALADRLGNIATAGFAGDIGGRGLNSIDRMVRKAQAAVRQRYAAMGMSGGTAEMQDLQAASDAGVDLQFKVGQQMAGTGLNAIAALTGQSAQIYMAMLNAQTAKDTALGNALANFAGSLVRG